MAKNAISKSEENRTCCSVIENAKNESRARRSKRTGPQSWFALKITIALALGIMGYTSYVYYDRICKPMLRRVPNALGSRGLGIAFLVVFSILFLMMLWTYVKVIVTPPGFAKNHVKKSKKPTHILPDQTRDSLTSDDVGGTSYENMLVSAEAAYLPPRANEESHPGHSHSTLRVDGGDTITPHRDGSRSSRSVDYERPVPSRPSPEIAGVLDAIQGPIRASRKAAAALPPQSNDDTRPGDLSRRPRMTPNLLPAYRYCSKDEHIKPLRAHHCRSCGTCVLKYDHHCPWIGQCVGARNQKATKFFVNFLQWSTVFCAWTFATLVALIPRVSKNDRSDIDAQHIVVIALSGLFLIFTGTLLMNHVTLILLNQTTVESIGHQDMKEQESAALGRVFGWYQCRAKRRKRREWDAEWGKIGLEGNLWWLGSLRANWEATMGVNPSWWILPIGRSASDGLNYPTNPRFDGEGRWRRRQDWPEGL